MITKNGAIETFCSGLVDLVVVVLHVSLVGLFVLIVTATIVQIVTVGLNATVPPLFLAKTVGIGWDKFPILVALQDNCIASRV